MLKNIVIKDLAIVSSLDIDFHSGMSALTGETGAGKSILIDALGLVLGNRAETGMIRAGEKRAEITATFDISQCSSAQNWLIEQELDDANELIIRRVLNASGSSKSFINGSPCPLKSLQTLGQMLINIHGQHAHQALLSTDHQRGLLDAYANLNDDLIGLKQQYQQWATASRELKNFKQAVSERSERQILLQFQYDELSHLNLIDNELRELAEQQKKLSHADSLLAGCEQIVDRLYDDEASVTVILAKHTQQLEQLAQSDEQLSEYAELLSQASILVEEAGRHLKSHTETIELDPEQLQQVENRLSQLHEVGRKYRCRPEELIHKLKTIEDELKQLNQQKNRLEELEASKQKQQKAYQNDAEKISQQRKKTAAELSLLVTDGMTHLNMPDAQFNIDLTQQDQPKVHGLDQINFLVTANKGQPLQALGKVASGGELSRISLVIQVATSQFAGVPSLIFDEVDVGISGAVAQVVGELLRKLGSQKQVLCVTHLPQVASQAHNHYQVSKQSLGNETQTHIKQLNSDQRIEEIARLLGGKAITESNRSNAMEMLAR